MSKPDYDTVNNPKHYHRQGINFECVELSTLFPHPVASAIEYVFRHQCKNGIEDLRKAMWWLQYAQAHEQLISFRVDGDTANERSKQLAQTVSGAEAAFWNSLAQFSTPQGMKHKQETIGNMLKTLEQLIKQEEEQ
ncbi:hypothetical protein GCM10007377_15880 [Galliscardovia ingluviei]|uniref:DUF3310 domain-containing protein n=1 Tax=Galliscardovia ingluviei TaxID=1769422 RepID=A0A8J3AKN5_9BIFI|nr:DUF3310 domain-containing protein [Galliscardovia ingluviei]GGI15434.1 hypothetical protein GCM10007377_15880 [Galliscardovia ingluviei]